MRRAAAILAALALTCPAAIAAAGTAPVTPRPPTAVGIAQHEYYLSAYRKSVRRGPVKFNITNLGEDTHNLVVKGPRRFRLRGPDVRSGERATLEATLRRRGTYRLLCTRANHHLMGMRTKLRVR